jgi:hypothetical protein
MRLSPCPAQTLLLLLLCQHCCCADVVLMVQLTSQGLCKVYSQLIMQVKQLQYPDATTRKQKYQQSHIWSSSSNNS